MLNSSLAPWPSYSTEEVAGVAGTLKSGCVNYWTGQEGRAFEREFAALTQTSYAVAVANGTLALDLALKALGVGTGDEVVVTPRTFIASVSCVVNAGARPVFADVDRESGNITAETVAAVLTPRTRAVICVHLGGWPCEMEEMMELSAAHDLAIIEDCAQAHGARYDGRPVGSIGQIGAWSFCQDKIMTTGGEGGMVTTNDKALWSAMWSFKDHGKSWEAVHERNHPSGFRWLHESFGTNWRMLEMQAAIGRIQIRHLPDWTAARTRNAERIAETARRYPGAIRVPMPRAQDTHAYYRLYAYVRPEGLNVGWDRDRIVAEVTARGIPLFQGSCSEVYLEKAFSGTDLVPPERLPVARELGETSLMFLTHPTLTDSDLNRVCATLDEVMRDAAR